MLQLLYKYLILHNRASVPGVGVFYIKRNSARLDFANKIFLAPTLQINFKSDTSGADNKIYTFISKEQKIDEAEAKGRYNNFANKLKETLVENNSVDLPGIGVLTQNAEGQLFFKATVEVNDYFPPVTAERVIRENSEHQILVGDLNRTNKQMKEVLVDDVADASRSKDYWWIFAIALGLIGIATIVYYYLHNGSLK
ncbi:hypothetical protein [Segetibacter koreensis]|uniref:hypothetical protein n=1 Tax=Segetibacter koreensis TaxID=398037 RepID=UPI0003814897|nr:hypothetical protein [Segetibacter koreensis]